MEHRPTIGLEIHVELKTRTKMFCDSLNDPDEHHPNTNVCPVCLGHPGTLPTINKQAVEHVIRVGLALGGKINPVTKFDRKNYFYPDLPKGYQISQYDQPLVSGGTLNGIRIRRVHLEEDTGTLVHEATSDKRQATSLVDFNRAGVPLMELVTEPELKSAEEVAAFAKELQMILRYLGVSDADMEKGQMRIEANVSVSPGSTADERGLNARMNADNISENQRSNQRKSASTLGNKVELKNINSFRFAKDAIEYEIKRQIEALEKGEKIHQETRGWNEMKKQTVSQRSKEEAHDYRYFPEPDLPPFEAKIFDIEKLREMLPELPAEKRARFKKEYGLDEKQTELLIANPETAEFFEEAVSELREMKADAPVQNIFNYLTSDLQGLLHEAGTGLAASKISPEHLAHLAFLIGEAKITSRQAKDILKKMFDTGLDPEDIVKDMGGGAVSDEGELESTADAVISENQSAVADYKKGKKESLQFLIGKAMAKLKGRGRPDLLREIFEKKL